MSKLTCLTDEKRPRVYVQNVLVCTGTTRTCVSTHVRVVPVHTGTFWTYTRGRVEWTHGVSKRVTHWHTQHNTTQHNTTTTPHDNRERQTETETERERQGERQGETGTDRDRESREERRFIFSVVVRGLFFVDVVFVWLIPFAHETWASQTVSSKIHSVPFGRLTVFEYLRILLFYAVTVFFFLNYFFAYAVTVSNFPNYLFMQLQFFFAGINSA